MASRIALRLAQSPTARLLVTSSSVRLLATKPTVSPSSQTDPAFEPKSSSSRTSEDGTLAESAKPSLGSQPKIEQPLNLSVLPSLDFDPASTTPLRGGRTGARAARDSTTTIEQNRKRLGRVSFTLLALGMAAGWVYMGREWEEGEEIPVNDGAVPFGRIKRANARISELFDYFNKPAWKELLPKPQHKPYTLLLSMDDLLVTSTWDREHGWRTAKRPGVDYFIAYLSQFFEIVIFTTQYHYTAIPIIEKLDPYTSYIAYKLFRESARSVGGKIVKDLSYLNRDLSKVILIDTHPEHISAQPENAILLPKWTGNSRDKGLVGLIPFLESVGIYQPPDVRPILKQYEGKDIAKTYALREAELKRKTIEDWQKSREGRRTQSGAVSKFTLSTLFGGSGAAIDPTQPPPTLLEIKRKEAQEYYQREQQWIKDNEAELKRMIEEDREKMMAEMGGSLLGVLSAFGQGPPAANPPTPSPPPSPSAANPNAPK